MSVYIIRDAVAQGSDNTQNPRVMDYTTPEDQTSIMLTNAKKLLALTTQLPLAPNAHVPSSGLVPVSAMKANALVASGRDSVVTAFAKSPQSMAEPNSKSFLSKTESVTDLHQQGRLAIAIVHGSIDRYLTCSRPTLALRSELRSLDNPPIQNKSATLLPSSDIEKARVSLYTRVEGPYAQTLGFRSPEKKLFMAFDARFIESFTDGDAMTTYGRDAEGFPMYVANTQGTHFFAHPEDLDQFVATHTWSGGLNEIILRMNNDALCGFGLVENSMMPPLSTEDYASLNELSAKYFERTGVSLPIFKYSDLTNRFTPISDQSYQYSAEKTQAQAKPFLRGENYYQQCQVKAKAISEALRSISTRLEQWHIKPDPLVKDRHGALVEKKGWFDQGYDIDANALAKELSESLLHHGIAPGSEKFNCLYHELYQTAHLKLRLTLALESIERLMQSDGASSTPVLFDEIDRDLKIDEQIKSHDLPLPSPLLLFLILPESHRSLDLCKDALKRGLPLASILEALSDDDYASLAVSVIDKLPSKLADVPEKVALEKPERYRKIIRDLARVNVQAIHKTSPHYAQLLALALEKNPAEISKIRPGTDVDVEVYKMLASKASSLDDSGFRGVNWGWLAKQDEAFCEPFWQKHAKSDPENVVAVPETARSFMALARSAIKQKPEVITKFWPAFYSPTIERATFAMLLKEAFNEDSSLQSKLAGRFRSMFPELFTQ